MGKFLRFRSWQTPVWNDGLRWCPSGSYFSERIAGCFNIKEMPLPQYRYISFRVYFFCRWLPSALAEPLVTLLSHPSHSVWVTASWLYVASAILRLPKTVMDKLQRDLATSLTPGSSPDAPLQALGHTYGLAVLASIVRSTLAWTLIASLMCLGLNFVRPHLHNYWFYGEMLFPNRRPRIEQVTVDGQSLSGCSFSTFERVLLGQFGVAFNISHPPGDSWCASLLSHALSFANSFISQNVEDLSDAQLPTVVKKGLTVRDRESLLRRSVHQYFTALGIDAAGSPSVRRNSFCQSRCLRWTSLVFPCRQLSLPPLWYIFFSLAKYGWLCLRRYVQWYRGFRWDWPKEISPVERWIRDNVEVPIDSLVCHYFIPIFYSRWSFWMFLEPETDFGCLWTWSTLSVWKTQLSDTEYKFHESPWVVDTMIEPFARRLLPLQSLRAMIKIIMQLLESVRLQKQT